MLARARIVDPSPMAEITNRKAQSTIDDEIDTVGTFVVPASARFVDRKWYFQACVDRAELEPCDFSPTF
jgi:hypothetical protein